MHPTARTAWLLGAALPLALAPAVLDQRLWLAWAVAVVAIAAGVVADAVLLLPARHVQVALDLPVEVELGDDGARASLRLAQRGRAAVTFTVVADLDPELEPWPELALAVAAGGEHREPLPLRARRRGSWRVQRLWLRWPGPLGLMARTRSRPLDRTVVVVPPARSTRAVAVRFFGSRTAAAGVKVERHLGEGSEFESLRAFVPGHDPRSVDWKASARHRRLLCRRFRAERNHQLVLAVDCGRPMADPLDGMPRLDHAIDRALALAYLGLRTGDKVGLFAFDAEPRAWVAPAPGVRAFARLRHATAGLAYASVETNFALGTLELGRRLRRRSLVVVFTDFADSVTAELMLDHVGWVARRHVVLFAALRDPALTRLETTEPRRLSDVHRAVVAAELRRERDGVLERLRRAGVQVVDAAPERATVQLVNRYLEVKRRELL